MLWLKAFHIIAVVSWMAALFYLPRLFVYHAMSEDTISRERFLIMERKLYRGIATPAMLASFIFGLGMVYLAWDYYRTQHWFWAKIVLVFLLAGYHGVCGKFYREFRDGTRARSHVFFRWFNEIPVLMLIGIVILVVVRPF
ncbi:MAG: protoporphyrinogen oxidase HemJ [Cellvibrio sp.]